MDGKKKLKCFKCKLEMVPERTDFTYLGQAFFTDILRCPKCGQVYIPEEFAKDRIAKVEEQLEDK